MRMATLLRSMACSVLARCLVASHCDVDADRCTIAGRGYNCGDVASGALCNRVSLLAGDRNRFTPYHSPLTHLTRTIRHASFTTCIIYQATRAARCHSRALPWSRVATAARCHGRALPRPRAATAARCHVTTYYLPTYHLPT